MKKLITISILFIAFSAQAQWAFNANGTGVQTATNTASGNYSTAMGSETAASGDFSTAMGISTIASGLYSTAMGSGTAASGNFSTAMGISTIASGFYSTAMGRNTTASGYYSTAMGEDTSASQAYSTAMGSSTIASGYGSTAMGIETTASRDASTAMGEDTSASGFASTAMGSITTASGGASTAMGRRTTASGNFSTAMGSGSTASDYASLSIGTYNTIQTTNATGFDLANRALVIGNGIGTGSESDALTVLFDGTTTIAGEVTATAFIGDGSMLTNLPNVGGTDDQTISILNNIVTLEDGGTIDLSSYLDNTDDQAITYDAVTNIVTLEAGGTIDLSALNNSGTDNQQLTLAGNSLNLEDGGAVDLSTYLDNTDNQNIAGSALVGTDLTIGIQGGLSETIDLSSLNNMGTDDQQLTLTGNFLDLENGGSVDLSGYLDNTDDQILANFILSGEQLSLTIQDGNLVSVDLAPLLQPLVDENTAQQVQIDAQQALIDDLINRMEALEDCACGTLDVPDNNPTSDGRAYLYQNVPNPFGDTTSIGYYIPIEHSRANLIISTTTGQILSNIAIRQFGDGTIEFNKATLQSAMYFYTLYVDGKKVDTKRMLVE